LSSKTEWDTGTNINTDTTSSGDVKINNKAASDISLAGMITTADLDSANKGNLIDGSTDTMWASTGGIYPDDYYWQGQLSHSYPINQISIWVLNSDWFYKIQVSGNGIDWSDATDWTIYQNTGMWKDFAVSYTDISYVKILCSRHTSMPAAPPGVIIAELKLYQPATATHTSAATQIDGSEGGAKNFIGWQTFTPTYDKPANTDISFKFRTSANGSSWTAYSAAQTPATGESLDISTVVDSASGANKYLQVETTLTNTDGASTPTLSEYSVGYHTNLAPSTPTAMTAVVGQ
jgi:hypothetical protein